MKIKAVIFDLDGVVISTDEYHYLAWKMIADQENIPFNREINEALRGVSRMESLDIILQKSEKAYSEADKETLACEKNIRYQELLEQINPDDILPGIIQIIEELRENKIKIAIGSSSKNARLILSRIGMIDKFDVIVDGNDIKKSKPDPEVFTLAANKMEVSPNDCVVVEDAMAGILAAKSAGMIAIGVGYASQCDQADYKCESLDGIDLIKFLNRKGE